MLNVEMTNENDFNSILEQERKEVKALCDNILRMKPDVVVTEKGVSELAAHFLLKGNCSVIRRLRKTDNNRISKVSGATVVNRPEELQESDVGLGCGLFEIRKIGDEFFAYFIECREPKACSIVLRGATKDVLNEMERNLTDAMCVGRNIYANPKLIPGGGAFEMEVSARLSEKAKTVEGLLQLPYSAGK
jgi:T-complex protein 1 subunit gamma